MPGATKVERYNKGGRTASGTLSALHWASTSVLLLIAVTCAQRSACGGGWEQDASGGGVSHLLKRMTKRTLERAAPPPEPKRARPAEEPWFVRVGLLQPVGGRTRYGGRASVPITSFFPSGGKDDLVRYSLIIPAFTHRSDIPSGEEKQRALPWLWNAYEHPRYFGVLDLDMDLGEVFKGKAPLFSDTPIEAYKDKSHVKKAFVKRLVSGCTFGQLLSLCPAFAYLYQAVRALVVALKVDHVTYFSGGGGFRVLFFSPHAWRIVTWGQNYAAYFHEHELSKLLAVVAPTLAPKHLVIILGATDKNVYDCDKGTKPDLLAHFETHVFPQAVHASFEAKHPDRVSMNPVLSKAIRDFWLHMFLSVPHDAPRIVAALSKPALGGAPAAPVMTNVARYPHALYSFPKVPIATATHLVLQGELTSYRRVDDPEALYRLMIKQKQQGIPLNVHEIRTPITRHALDYDGGPPLMDPLRRSDGQTETPLHALQQISKTHVLASGLSFTGLLLTCPPRAGTTGSRAHLIWPEWHVRLTDEKAIMLIMQGAMLLRWPAYDWPKILESPLRMRALFSDTLNKETGVMSNRALCFDTEFDVNGVATTCADTSDLALLRLCSLRLMGAVSGSEAALLPSLVKRSRSTTPNASLDKLPQAQRDAVMATLQTALELVRVKHDKPLAQFYSGIKVFAGGSLRMVTVGLSQHRQCAQVTPPHRGNNVELRLHMDRDEWELRCYKSGCPQHDKADGKWGRGVVDTSALRAAWPIVHSVVTSK